MLLLLQVTLLFYEKNWVVKKFALLHKIGSPSPFLLLLLKVIVVVLLLLWFSEITKRTKTMTLNFLIEKNGILHDKTEINEA